MVEENPKVVSERLRHSTIVLTLDTYSHALSTMQQQATARLEKMLYSNRGSKHKNRLRIWQAIGRPNDYEQPFGCS